jgi:hypothetical protein
MVHFIISFGLFLYTFDMTMARFDNGKPIGFLDRQANILSEILFFPLVPLARLLPNEWFLGVSGYLPFVLNSFLWAIMLYFGYRWFQSTGPKKK